MLKSSVCFLFFGIVLSFNPPFIRNSRSVSSLRLADKSDIDDNVETEPNILKSLYPGTHTLDINFKEHKPMGCTVDESLLDDGRQPILVTKVTSGGNAEKAGLQVGDVVVAMTGIFGEVENILGADLDHVKKLVSARPKDEPLEVKVVRGSNVMQLHESAIVDMCTTQSAEEKEMEDCMMTYFSSGYDMEEDGDDYEQDATVAALLENMEDVWAEEMPESDIVLDELVDVEESKDPEEAAEPLEPKARPWSSRSSPSGTFVRNPQTGKMENIG